MPHSTLEYCRRCRDMRPIGHIEHGKLGRATNRGEAFGGGGFESATATGPRGTTRLPPSMIRQDATVGQS
ncbi:hypothetical protein QBC32DRAFT_45313 [Pseudoneurospora amorphoporcata]|uniref:Uncharacterized protein n=1 Tax=Pseudoneurospora amorphoporcata TaxID=241081 RepID=A0AAN6SCW4_9PEZI|nr:hypothetical protein QBC32DRAFT_45313 [Pseudoneurospora amorphoporcata]